MDPDAKVLVHCGWAHLQEQPTSSWEPMAHFVREIAGIDPLTVDQTLLGERSEPGFEHVVRVEAERQGLAGADSVVLYLPSEAAIVLLLFDLEGNVLGGRPVG